jgi:hypothetical protein
MPGFITRALLDLVKFYSFKQNVAVTSLLATLEEVIFWCVRIWNTWIAPLIELY